MAATLAVGHVPRKKTKTMQCKKQKLLRINLQHHKLLPTVVRAQTRRLIPTSVAYALLKMCLKALAWNGCVEDGYCFIVSGLKQSIQTLAVASPFINE